MRTITSLTLLIAAVLWGGPTVAAPPPLDKEGGSARYLKAATRFADRVLASGTDNYGVKHTPLFVDGLDAKTLSPAVWIGPEHQQWVLSNWASQQPLVRLLVGLSAVTGDPHYKAAAEGAATFLLNNTTTPNGLLPWGGHLAWDLTADQLVGEREHYHELKGHLPFLDILWQVNPKATQTLLQQIWGAHILNWSLLDYNRHGSITKSVVVPWDHSFNARAPVPFPAVGNNLAFVAPSISYMSSAFSLATHVPDHPSLQWGARLMLRWQQARNPDTGLSGGILSERKDDRAKRALGHRYPQISEARLIAANQQIGRYHELPLAQLQFADLIKAGLPNQSALVNDLVTGALFDLRTYWRVCFDPSAAGFRAVLTDGTLISGDGAKSGYYDSHSFAPQPADGQILWAFATAYGHSRAPQDWDAVRTLGQILKLGDFGTPQGQGRSLVSPPRTYDWRIIYALIALAEATGDRGFIQEATHVADYLVSLQAPTGLFPRPGASHARTGDEIPLALLHLAAAMRQQHNALPAMSLDKRYFHARYYGPLAESQKKRADERTTDTLVFYKDDPDLPPE
jgi:pectate lyase